MNFIYFVPSRLTKPPEELAYAFADINHSATEIASGGPDGNPGTLFTVPADRFKVRSIDHETQQWRKIPGSNNWLGWMPEDPPKPSELVRDSMMAGHHVTLCDGEEWQIPIARKFVGENGDLHVESMVPVRYALNDDGDWIVGNVTDRYQRLWEIADLISDHLSPVANDEIELTIADSCDLCSEILAINYRLSRIEVGTLQLLDDYTSLSLLTSVLDFQALSKKKIASDTCNSSRGAMDDVHNTTPVTQTSS